MGIRKKQVREIKVVPEQTKAKIPRQIRFAKDALRKAREEGKAVVWIDETMFTRKVWEQKEWSARCQNFEVSQEDLKITTKAFIGGICEGAGLVHYELEDFSIDKEKFWKFVTRLKEKMKGRAFVMYLDNLKVHTCNDSKEFLEEAGVECVWAPCYSPDYNAIELYFSQLKYLVKRARLREMIRREVPTYEDLVEEAVDKIEVEKIDKCV